MYERKFNAEDVRPDGYENGTVYTVKKPLECRYGTFKEGSKVVLEVEGLHNLTGDEITFSVIGDDESDLFTIKVSPNSINWLNEHFEKDKELSQRLSEALKKDLAAKTSRSERERKLTQAAVTVIAIALLLGVCLLFVYELLYAAFHINVSMTTVVAATVTVCITFLTSIIMLIWNKCIDENAYWKAYYAYKETQKRILSAK